MDIEKMFIVLVNIVVITLLLVQTNVILNYLYIIIYAFVLVVLFLLLVRERVFRLREFYLLLCTVVGFLFLALHIVMPNDLLTSDMGYLLIAAFFWGLVLLGFGRPETMMPVKEGKKTEKRQRARFSVNQIKKQAKELEAAEKKLQKMTKKLKKKPRKKTTKKRTTKKKTAKKGKK